MTDTKRRIWRTTGAQIQNFKTEPVHDGYLSNDVRLTGFRAIRRVCSICEAND